MENPIRIENFKYKGVRMELAEIKLVSCWSNANGSATTHHEVSSVETIDGEEIVELQKGYNLPFEYNGGNIFEEGFAAIVALVTNPSS